MSISVAIDELRASIADTDRAPYLITVSDDGRPHTVAVACGWDGDELTMAIGKRTLANARARPLLCLLWPPRERTGYSLIVDAEVTSTETPDGGDGENVLRVRPTRAVQHRPAPGSGLAYDPDCVRLDAD